MTQDLRKTGAGNAMRAGFCLLVFVTMLNAGTIQAPGSGIPIPTGTWTLVLTRDLPEETNGWEQLVYASSVQRSIMLSQYHQTNSEPNESLVGYNFDTNSWEVMDMGGLFHTENMPEGGESQGYFGYDPSTSSIVYHCCTSGSNQAEDENHTWWFDLLGQSGRDKQTPNEPPAMALQPGGAFDAADNVFVMFGGASYTGTWIYSPVTNSWQQRTPGGTLPDPSMILPAMAYSSSAQQVFLFGGRNGSTYYSNLYSYSVPLNTWTLISPAGGVQPPGRLSASFAYDSTNNVFLLYGGQGASGVLHDTWIFNPVTNAWTQLEPPQSPTISAAPDYARLAYDSDHNVFVLSHHGSSEYFGGTWGTLAAQTWLFRYQGAGPSAGTLLSTTQPAPGSLNHNTASWAKDPALATSGTSVYVAWSETGSPFSTAPAPGLHISASQYSGGNWTALGTSYQSISAPSDEAHSPSLALVGSTPWISWYQSLTGSTSAAQVNAASWNGSFWQGGQIGLVGSSTSSVQGRSQIANVGGTPYIAFIEVHKSVSPQTDFAYVKAWNGNSWVLQGTGALNRNTANGSTAASISIASNGTTPYVAWTEYVRGNGPQGGLSFTNPQVYVSYFNGTQWAPLGGSLNVSSSTGWANDASIAFFGGQPYVAWTERSQTGNNQLYVATWNGTAWVQAGSGSLNQGGANGWAFHPSLAADPVGNNLYVAWVEQTALGQKAQVFVSQLMNGSWTTLGGALNADPIQGSAQRVSLGVLNSQPVAAWGEVDFGTLRNVYASQWNGSSWTQLSGTGGPADTTAPTTPKTVVAAAVSPSQINLNWSGATDVVGVYGYYVYRNGSQIANVTSTLSYQDSGLTPSTKYSYTVAAYDAAGNISAQSKALAATTFPNSTPPTVSVTAPTNGSTLVGTITVSANATDAVGMANVQFQVDGANLGSPIAGSGPTYSTAWNTATASNGSHTVTAIATDTVGLTATSSVTVTVANTVTPPTVSITTPANGAVVLATVSVAANATSSLGIASVQFQIDGVNLGGAVTGPGPTYTTSWNTTTATNGAHTVSAIATDMSGNTATSSENVTVSNFSNVEPVISGVAANSITSSTATVNWTTNEPSTSQVAYGLTSSYGMSSTLNSTLVTSHAVALSGLTTSTTYHFQVTSVDANGNSSSSPDSTFTTAPAGLQTVMQIQGNSGEVSGTTTGSIVTPSVTPAGFSGKVVANGKGSVNFSPAQSGNGMYFLNCCTATNNAYFQFTGATIGNIFNTSQGQISFFLQSQYSFAQRQASAAAARYAFDVRDGNNSHLFYFFTSANSQALSFTYAVGGTSQIYYVPQGTEDTLFGEGVVLQVSLSWNGSVASLSLNGNVVKSATYTPTAPNWTSASNFDFGAYQYQTSGYNVEDDVIGNLVVAAPTQ